MFTQADKDQPNEPDWLANASAELYKNDQSGKKLLPKKTHNNIYHNIDHIPTITDTITPTFSQIPQNTFVIADEKIVIELQGVLTPAILSALAPQRVLLPLVNRGVIYIGGAKKIVRIGQWTIDLDSYNEEEHSYKSSTKITPVKTRTYSTKGRIKTLHSLKRQQYLRR
jgi:hypothetical protein